MQVRPLQPQEGSGRPRLKLVPLLLLLGTNVITPSTLVFQLFLLAVLSDQLLKRM